MKCDMAVIRNTAYSWWTVKFFDSRSTSVVRGHV